jgi:HAD superfamily hydrolase (TIGR01509 family)
VDTAEPDAALHPPPTIPPVFGTVGLRLVAGRLAAVLFDLDGTLVDTEKVWGIALSELVTRYGGVLTDAVRTEMIGGSSAFTMALVDRHYGPIDRREGSAWLDARVKELYTDGVVWRPGAAELLETVRAAGIPLALVTNTNRPLVDVLLGMLGRFDVVICGDEVERGKPDPQPYAYAAARLGVDPRDCVAIEDSPAGLISARGAGCAVIAVPNEVPLYDVDGLLVGNLLDVDLSTLESAVAMA